MSYEFPTHFSHCCCPKVLSDLHSCSFVWQRWGVILADVRWQLEKSYSILGAFLRTNLYSQAATSRQVRVLPQVPRASEPLHFVICFRLWPGRGRVPIRFQFPVLVLSLPGPPRTPGTVSSFQERDHWGLSSKSHVLHQFYHHLISLAKLWKRHSQCNPCS